MINAGNSMHYTSIGLSQMGRDAANNIAKYQNKVAKMELTAKPINH